MRSATDHYLRSLRSPPNRATDHYWRSLRSPPATNHYFRSLRSADPYVRAVKAAPVDHYLRSLRQAPVDHYLRSLRAAPINHYLRSLRQAPVDHYLRSLRQAPVDHYLRSLRQAPVDHYLRSLREDPDASSIDNNDDQDIIGSKDLRSAGALSDHMFRSRRSPDDSDKRSENGEMHSQAGKNKLESSMPAYWDQSLRTVRF